jgi:hypothetical protein
MRSLIMIVVTATSLFSAGCWVGPRERPVARYHHHEYRRVGPPPPVYYEHRGHYRDDRGYRDRQYRYYR